MTRPKLLPDLAAFVTRQICGITSFAKGIDLQRPTQRIYFGNHSSHFDFLAIWASLPQRIRLRTRPVAARDYWERTRVRKYLSREVFGAVFVDRGGSGFQSDPLEEIKEALRAGDSIILFPEGTRSADGTIQPFKKGIFFLAHEFADVELVPVYLENLNRILPKGEFLVLPLLSRVIFGPPLPRVQGEERKDFVERARSSLMELAI